MIDSRVSGDDSETMLSTPSRVLYI